MTTKKEYVRVCKQYWYSMFPIDGYIGDGVYVEDLDFEEDYDEMTEEERTERVNEMKEDLKL